MNVVKEINRINDRELELAATNGASWHDTYKDSAYIHVGGLHFDLTEGDVITIFSQYGEVMDVNLPRDKQTGKSTGFGFIMYEDQRSTVLAVDNLNGAKVLDRTLKVDHVRQYKQQKVEDADGNLVEREEQSLNAKPQMIMDQDDASSESSESSGPEINPEDPMASFLLEKRRGEKARKKAKKAKSKEKRKNETPEEKRARKEKKQEKKARKASKKSSGLQGVENLLKSLGSGAPKRPRSPSLSPPRARSPSPRYFASRDGRRNRDESAPRSRTPTDRPRERRGYIQERYHDGRNDDRDLEDRRKSRAEHPLDNRAPRRSYGSRRSSRERGGRMSISPGRRD